MPEIVTQYPDVLLKTLQDANVKCGTGEPQQILVSCPKDRFCSFPTGELCVYGVKELSHMTQISARDFLFMPNILYFWGTFSVIVFLFGLFIGSKLSK